MRKYTNSSQIKNIYTADVGKNFIKLLSRIKKITNFAVTKTS